MFKGSKLGVAGIRARWAPGALFLCALFLPRLAEALDASVLAGITDSVDTDETTYAWQLDFRHNFESPFTASASWINEGHFRDHHRDGLAGEIWGRIPVASRKASFAFGGGAYWYFDTRRRTNGSHENTHGWAPILSVSASYFADSPWFVRLTANHIRPPDDVDTNAFLLGIGYRLGREPVEEPSRPRPAGESPRATTGAELTPFLGEVIHNSLESRAGIAAGIEYRRGLARNLDWTLTWLNEDNPAGIRRNGLGTQVWLVDSFIHRRVVLGIGGGLYAFYDRPPPPGTHNPVDLAGLITLTGGYRFAERWIARLNWNRVMTDNDRDTDVIVLGAGYRWNE